MAVSTGVGVIAGGIIGGWEGALHGSIDGAVDGFIGAVSIREQLKCWLERLLLYVLKKQILQKNLNLMFGNQNKVEMTMIRVAKMVSMYGDWMQVRNFYSIYNLVWEESREFIIG